MFVRHPHENLGSYNVSEMDIKTNMIKGKIADRSKEELCFIIGDNILFHQGVYLI